MATRPSKYPSWGTTGTKVEPSTAKKALGWIFEEFPPYEWVNWLSNLIDEWVQWFDQEVELTKGRVMEVESDLLWAYGSGLLSGMELSRSGVGTVDLSSGIFATNIGAFDIARLTSSIANKDVLTTWASGPGAGGNSVAVTGDTWYYVFALWNDPNIDFGFDTDISASNLLANAAVVSAGYTKARRIGAVRTNAGATDIWDFNQRSDYFTYVSDGFETLTMGSGGGNDTQTTTGKLLPPKVFDEAELRIIPNGSPVEGRFNIGTTAALPGFPFEGYSDYAVNASNIVLESTTRKMLRSRDLSGSDGEVVVRVQAANSQQVQVYALGWVDRRGQDGNV